MAYAGVKFKTYSGLPFSYEVRKGKNDEYTKELWSDIREIAPRVDILYDQSRMMLSRLLLSGNMTHSLTL